MEERVDRTGEENYNTFGTLMKIVEYRSAVDIIVEFQDEYKTKVHTNYGQFKKGQVKNPYDKSVFSIGYLGEGKYKSKDENGKMTKVYVTWAAMIQRCYDPYFLDKHPTYRDCMVCELWYCFQNFAQWYYENYYEVENERMHLDKDILYKGNKIYSPETCIFVPNRINVLFTKSDKIRGEYSVGVRYHKASRKLSVHCKILDENEKRKQKHLGYFPLNRPFQAFYTYKIFKENYIKQVADEYKDLIPIELYDALCKWEVEIND